MEDLLMRFILISISATIGLLAQKGNDSSRKIVNIIFAIFTLIGFLVLAYVFWQTSLYPGSETGGEGWGYLIYATVGFFLLLISLPGFLLSLPFKKIFRVKKEPSTEDNTKQNTKKYYLVVFTQIFIIISIIFIVFYLFA